MAFAPPALLAKRPSSEPGVAAALAPLARDGWRIAHGVTIGTRGCVEHVAIGRGGAFAVAGHVPSLLGAAADPAAVDAASAQARLLERVTGAEVTPVLALSRGRARAIDVRGVTVVPASLLAAHLGGAPLALTPDRVHELDLLVHAAVAAHAAA